MSPPASVPGTEHTQRFYKRERGADPHRVSSSPPPGAAAIPAGLPPLAAGERGGVRSRLPTGRAARGEALLGGCGAAA